MSVLGGGVEYRLAWRDRRMGEIVPGASLSKRRERHRLAWDFRAETPVPLPVVVLLFHLVKGDVRYESS